MVSYWKRLSIACMTVLTAAGGAGAAGYGGIEELSQELKANYRAPGFNGSFEFWVTGTLSPKGKKDLQARGFSVVEQAGTRIDIVN